MQPSFFCSSSTLPWPPCHDPTTPWADYCSPLSRTETIASVNDGVAARAQRLNFPAQLSRRTPSHPVNNSVAPAQRWAPSISSVCLHRAEGPSVIGRWDGSPSIFTRDWHRLDDSVRITGLFLSSVHHCAVFWLGGSSWNIYLCIGIFNSIEWLFSHWANIGPI